MGQTDEAVRGRAMARANPLPDMAMRAPSLRRLAAFAGAILLPAILLDERLAITVGIGLFLAGLPHGLMQGARINPRLRSAKYWLTYLAVSAACAFALLIAPVAGLMAFLALSLFHFATSQALPSRIGNLAVALLAVGGPALFQPNATSRMLESAIGETLPSAMIAVLMACGGAGIIAAIIAATEEDAAQSSLIWAIPITGLLQPVLAVGLLFYLFHAAPIQQRAAGRHQICGMQGSLQMACAIVLWGSLALVELGSPGPELISIGATIAIALVIPHMIEDALANAIGPRRGHGARYAARRSPARDPGI